MPDLEIIEVVVETEIAAVQVVVENEITAIEVIQPGPQGPIGETGPQGPQGEPGPAGVAVGITIDGGGLPIKTGFAGDLEIPFDMDITGWTLVSDVQGSIVIDVWRDTFANFPPTDADTIAGTEKPTIANGTKAQDLTLSTWSASVTAGDVLRFNVDSVASITRATLTLRGEKL